MVVLLLQTLAVVIGGFSLVALVDVALSLRSVRVSVSQGRTAIRTLPLASLSGPDGCKSPAGGEAIWQFRQGKWELDESRPQPGYEPGPPPTFPGGYEGHRVRQSCVPRRKA
jgi:hypothetical protein